MWWVVTLMDSLLCPYETSPSTDSNARLCQPPSWCECFGSESLALLGTKPRFSRHLDCSIVSGTMHTQYETFIVQWCEMHDNSFKMTSLQTLYSKPFWRYVAATHAKISTKLWRILQSICQKLTHLGISNNKQLLQILREYTQSKKYKVALSPFLWRANKDPACISNAAHTPYRESKWRWAE